MNATSLKNNWPFFLIFAVLLSASLWCSQRGGGCVFFGALPWKTSNPLPTEGETMIEKVHQADFQEKVLKSETPVLVDFYADWCPPCRAMAPVLERLAAETPSAKIVKVNVDHNPDLAAQYGIASIPTLIVFRDGRPVERHVGMADVGKLSQMLSP